MWHFVTAPRRERPARCSRRSPRELPQGAASVGCSSWNRGAGRCSAEYFADCSRCSPSRNREPREPFGRTSPGAGSRSRAARRGAHRFPLRVRSPRSASARRAPRPLAARRAVRREVRALPVPRSRSARGSASCSPGAGSRSASCSPGAGSRSRSAPKYRSRGARREREPFAGVFRSVVSRFRGQSTLSNRRRQTFKGFRMFLHASGALCRSRRCEGRRNKNPGSREVRLPGFVGAVMR